jgi:predicted ArsR family transcriptional regulator
MKKHREKILQLLAERAHTSLELIEKVDALLSTSVYGELRALESEGRIEHYDGPATPERGGRPQSWYRLSKVEVALSAITWECPECQRTDPRAGATWGCSLCKRRLVRR